MWSASLAVLPSFTGLGVARQIVRSYLENVMSGFQMTIRLGRPAQPRRTPNFDTLRR